MIWLDNDRTIFFLTDCWFKCWSFISTLRGVIALSESWLSSILVSGRCLLNDFREITVFLITILREYRSEQVGIMRRTSECVYWLTEWSNNILYTTIPITDRTFKWFLSHHAEGFIWYDRHSDWLNQGAFIFWVLATFCLNAMNRRFISTAVLWWELIRLNSSMITLFFRVMVPQCCNIRFVEQYILAPYFVTSRVHLLIALFSKILFQASEFLSWRLLYQIFLGFGFTWTRFDNHVSKQLFLPFLHTRLEFHFRWHVLFLLSLCLFVLWFGYLSGCILYNFDLDVWIIIILVWCKLGCLEGVSIRGVLSCLGIDHGLLGVVVVRICWTRQVDGRERLVC